jgi:hypothetical protein
MPVRHAAKHENFFLVCCERHPVRLASASGNRLRRCIVVPPRRDAYQRDHDHGCRNYSKDPAHESDITAEFRHAQRRLTTIILCDGGHGRPPAPNIAKNLTGSWLGAGGRSDCHEILHRLRDEAAE